MALVSALTETSRGLRWQFLGCIRSAKLSLGRVVKEVRVVTVVIENVVGTLVLLTCLVPVLRNILKMRIGLFLDVLADAIYPLFDDSFLDLADPVLQFLAVFVHNVLLSLFGSLKVFLFHAEVPAVLS